VIPLGARIGIGVLVAALVAGSGFLPPIAIAGALAVATAAALLAGRRAAAGGPGKPSAARWRLAAGVAAGAWLLVARVLAGGGLPETRPADLPEGPGPWAGRVTTLGTPREGTQRFTVTLANEGETILAVTAPRYPAVEPGDAVRLSGRPQAPPEGGYGDYLRRTGVAGTLRSPDLAVLAHATDPAGLLERTRRATGDALARALPEPAAGLAAGILVGLRDRVDRDLAAAFTATGLSHVVAISGWNIALVAGLVGSLLAGRARRTRSCLILVAIAGYTVLAGASASVVRAAAMAGVALLARESGRPGTAAAALGWAVALLVLAAPANAGDVGLQLSAAATAGLIAWSGPITGAIERRAPLLPGWVREGLGVSLAAQAATLPIVLLAFGRVAPLSPLTNLAVVPLVPLAMAAGTVALAGGGLAAAGAPGVLATLAGVPGALVLGLLIGIVRLAAALPLASVTLPPALAAAAAGAAVLGLMIFASRRRIVLPPGRLGRLASRLAEPAVSGRETVRAPTGRPEDGHKAGRPPGGHPRARGDHPGPSRRLLRVAGLGAALALAVLAVGAATRPDGRAHVTVLDVGQGDAILVTGPSGGRMLVDGGPDPDRLLVALDARVPSWDRRLDLVVLTHPHEDHVAGLPLVLERYRVGRVLEPGMPGQGPGYEAFATAVSAGHTPGGRLVAGDRLILDGIAVEVLWPDADRVPAEATDDGSAVNDASIVLLGAFEGRRFLLAADAETDVEERIVTRGLPPVDLLKAGHHGSRTSSSPALVGATRPRLVAVSVGAKNDYGHPSPEVLERLETAGAIVLRTDQLGTIDVALGAAGVEVRTERGVRRGAWATTPTIPADAAGPGADATAAGGTSPASATLGIGGRAGRRGGPTFRAGRRPGLPPGLPYDRLDARSLPPGRRRPAPLARAACLAPPSFACRRRGRGLARGALRGTRSAGRPVARRGGRAPPRRRQGPPPLRPGRGPPPRRGLRRLAGGPRASGARAGRRRPFRHAPRRAGRSPVAGRRDPGRAPRRLRRQARRPPPRADGGALRRLATALPDGLEHGRPGARRCPRDLA
jgi:competence protein ComEC